MAWNRPSFLRRTTSAISTRCWYWRLQFPCYLHGGNRCHAREGEHREHAIFATTPCASAHPSDPAAALLALGATVRTSGRQFPLADLYRLPTADNRSLTTLEPGEFRAVTLDPLPSNQRITVTVHSAGAPIDVYAILEADEKAALKVAEESLRSNKPPTNVVDGRPKVNDTSFTVQVAAKSGLSVLLINGSTKKADVSITMVGR